MVKRKITDQIQINVRMREGLRAKLEQSAKKNYESLNREIVDRLERSFDRQDLLIEALSLAYGGEIAARLMMMGRAMHEAGRMAAAAVDPQVGPDVWVRNPFAYQQAAQAAMTVLVDFRPDGDPPAAPKSAWLPEDYDVEHIGLRAAKSLTLAVKGKAPPDLRKFAATIRELLEPEKGNDE